MLSLGCCRAYPADCDVCIRPLLTRISQAGAIIIREAGGYFGGGKTAFARGENGESESDDKKLLMSRRYCSVRPVAASATETARAIQERVIGELYHGELCNSRQWAGRLISFATAIEQPKDIIHDFPEKD